MNFAYDRIKDTPDNRDHLAAPPAIVLPSSADLRPYLGPVKNQGQLGSCTAHAGTGLREFLYRKLTQYEADKTVAANLFRLSPLFLYQMEREIEGTFGSDEGAQSRSIFVALSKYGCLLEQDDPYIEGNAEKLTDADADHMAKAAVYSKIAYHRVLDTYTLRGVLASGYAATVGTPVFSSFERDDVAASGDVLLPTATGDNCIGGHEMLVCGYSDSRPAAGGFGAFCVRNSWGADWGDGGNCWVPYAYFNSPAVAAQGGADFWTAHLGKPW